MMALSVPSRARREVKHRRMSLLYSIERHVLCESRRGQPLPPSEGHSATKSNPGAAVIEGPRKRETKG